MASTFSQGRALIIGVANYAQVRKLPEKVLDDARDVAALLGSPEHCGYPASQVDILLDGQATALGIRAGLGRLGQSAKPDDTVVVFFSGHGGRVVSGPEMGIYLIPADCDPKRVKDTAISADEFTNLLAGVKAARLVVLLDACHSGGAGDIKATDLAGELKAGLDEKTYAQLAQGTGRVVMASSRSTENSLVLPGMRNSLFTRHLLDALRGKAHLRGDGQIRVLDVFHYVSDKVPPDASQHRASQHPIFKAHELENNFPLALASGGKQLTAQLSDSSSTLRPTSLNGKARIEIRKGLISRWVDLADYFDVPLEERDRIKRAESPAGSLLDWIEERRRLAALRDGFCYLGMDDLVEVLDRHPR